jgi:hypothetical protein
MSDWQPIETAPRGGTAVLLYVPEYAGHKDNPYVLNCYWGGAAEWMLSGIVSVEECRLRGEPTHWAPLPEPPVYP